MGTLTKVAPNYGNAASKGIADMLSFDGELYAKESGSGVLRKWNGSNAWVEVVAKVGAEEFYDGGIAERSGELIAGGYTSQCLLQLNGTSWTTLAPWVAVNLYLTDVAVNTANGYVYTSMNGRLYKWTGSGNWTYVAEQMSAEYVSKIIIRSGDIYGLGSSDGYLLRYISGSTWSIAANPYESYHGMSSFVLIGSTIYAAGTWSGKLLSWAGGSWSLKAGPYSTDEGINDLVVYNDEIYAATCYGNLLKWNGVDAWELAAAAPVEGMELKSLAVHSGQLYAGSYADSGDERACLYWFGSGVSIDTVPVEVTVSLEGAVYGAVVIIDAESSMLECATSLAASMETVEIAVHEQDSDQVVLTQTVYEGSGSFEVDWSIQGYGGAEAELEVDLSVSATGSIESVGAAAIMLSAGLLSISGGASGSITAGASSITATGLAEYVAAASLGIEAFSINAVGSGGQLGTASIALGPAVITATGITEVSGNASITIGPATLWIVCATGSFGNAALTVDWDISITGAGGVFGDAAIVVPAAVINALSAGTTQAHLLYNRWRQ